MLRQELASSAFSLLFPMGFPPEQRCYHKEDGAGGPAVDCTLSLGTPSTRRAVAAGAVHVHTPGAAPHGQPPRRCANCDTTSTPLWRNGPRGPKSLCNACGIRYKKEERRAAAAVAPAPATQLDSGIVGPYACGGYARPAPAQWGCYGPAAGSKSACYGMYGGEVVVDAAAADGPCLSWMLNVMPSSSTFAVRERPTLFQYY